MCETIQKLVEASSVISKEEGHPEEIIENKEVDQVNEGTSVDNKKKEENAENATNKEDEGENAKGDINEKENQCETEDSNKKNSENSDQISKGETAINEENLKLMDEENKVINCEEETNEVNRDGKEADSKDVNEGLNILIIMIHPTEYLESIIIKTLENCKNFKSIMLHTTEAECISPRIAKHPKIVLQEIDTTKFTKYIDSLSEISKEYSMLFLLLDNASIKQELDSDWQIDFNHLRIIAILSAIFSGEIEKFMIEYQRRKSKPSWGASKEKGNEDCETPIVDSDGISKPKHYFESIVLCADFNSKNKRTSISKNFYEKYKNNINSSQAKPGANKLARTGSYTVKLQNTAAISTTIFHQCLAQLSECPFVKEKGHLCKDTDKGKDENKTKEAANNSSKKIPKNSPTTADSSNLSSSTVQLACAPCSGRPGDCSRLYLVSLSGEKDVNNEWPLLQFFEWLNGDTNSLENNGESKGSTASLVPHNKESVGGMQKHLPVASFLMEGKVYRMNRNTYNFNNCSKSFDSMIKRLRNENLNILIKRSFSFSLGNRNI